MMNQEDMEEFENQLKQEEMEKLKRAEIESRTRKDEDGTVYEFDPVKKAWFPKIDEDFIAKYQLSYGASADGSSSTSFWQNPPADVNSEEYKIWYEQYSKYYKSLHQTASMPKAPATSLSTSYDIDDPEYFGRYLDPSQLDEDDVDCKNVNDTKDAKKLKNKKAKKDKTEKKSETVSSVSSEEADKKRKSTEHEWFEIDDSKNTNVYVSGLPPEITEEEFKELMNKAGLIAFDPVLRKPKLRLYKGEDGNYKGDGRCCYMKPESVQLALNYLDGSDFKGFKISVEKAKFEQKGQYDPTKKKRKLSKNEKKKFQEKQNRLLGWLPDKNPDSRPRYERIVVIKNVFTPKEFEDDPSQINEISADMREECSKFGEVRKVVVYDRHDEGVVTVMFKKPEEADLCVKALHGRWFAKRQLFAANYDGKTKYQVNETEQEMNERLQKWRDYLDNGSTAKTDDENKTLDNGEGGSNSSLNDSKASSLKDDNYFEDKEDEDSNESDEDSNDS
ncbi:hypothetical protein HELRODRAFT_108808 [Helobdella robusta]|uniref:17S U2 SnRNP complex component HTATSF1 n=1 Tax=Helobdella robusta TaxID=6412 RepID=T1EEM7_HELRO|nr:hypothetical protein HELRODRAFT_108808 [Helobdella robusta]ESO11520.1 hypothetical protein HELRODRAFT_108808 [Helobdella robusta]